MKAFVMMISIAISGCVFLPKPEPPSPPSPPDLEEGDLHEKIKEKEAAYYDKEAHKVRTGCRNRITRNELEETARDIWQRTYDPLLQRGDYRPVHCREDSDYPELPPYMYDTGWEYDDCPSRRSEHCVDGEWTNWY